MPTWTRGNERTTRSEAPGRSWTLPLVRLAVAAAWLQSGTAFAQFPPAASGAPESATTASGNALDRSKEWLVLDAAAIDAADLAGVRKALEKLPDHSVRVQMRPGVQAGELIRVAADGIATRDVIPIFAFDTSVAMTPDGGSGDSCIDLRELAERQKALIEALEKELASCQESGGGTR